MFHVTEMFQSCKQSPVPADRKIKHPTRAAAAQGELSDDLADASRNFNDDVKDCDDARDAAEEEAEEARDKCILSCAVLEAAFGVIFN